MRIEDAYDKIYRYVWHRTYDRETAENITQETFLRYIRQYGHSKGYNMKLMYTIAKNLCIDEYRREDPVPVSDLERHGRGSYMESEENMMSDDLVLKMIAQEALQGLSRDERELLLLRYVNGESMASISELFNCSRFSAYRTIKRARKKFADYMEMEIHDE